MSYAVCCKCENFAHVKNTKDYAAPECGHKRYYYSRRREVPKGFDEIDARVTV